MDELLEKLKELGNKQTTEIFIPSLDWGGKIRLKSLTGGHMKMILNTITNDANFDKVLLDVIKDTTNIHEDKINNLNIFDVILITFYLRVFNIGRTVTTENGVIIDLGDHLFKLGEYIFPKAVSWVEGEITLNADVPSFSDRIRANDILASLQDEHQESLIGKVFISELAKYVSGVSINGIEQMPDYQSLSYENRMKVVEVLPQTLITKLLVYIQDIQSMEEELLHGSYDDKRGNIPFNAQLFNF